MGDGENSLARSQQGFDFYPGKNGQPLEDLERSMTSSNLSFKEIILAAVLRITSKGNGQRKW